MSFIASETGEGSPTNSDVDLEINLKPKLKRRNLSPRKKLCPECLSEIRIKTALSGWLVPDYYICDKCGYSGYVALEEISKEE